MAGKISNPRDLVVLLLGELLFVERRLAGQVLRELADAVAEDELKTALVTHLAETKLHVERLESAFLQLDMTPSAHLSQGFESGISQHDELQGSIVEPRLADLFHAQAALHIEHWELSAYETLEKIAPAEIAKLLRPSFDDERAFAERLRHAIGRLAGL